MMNETVRKRRVLLTGILATGITGCGKSVLMDSLKVLLDPHNKKTWIMRAEMSSIIEWGKGLQGHLGDQVRESASLMGKGKYLPDEAVIALFPEWVMSHLPENHPETVLVLASGCPRTVEQLQMLSMFQRSCVIHQLASEEVARKSVLKRYNDTHANQRRSDDKGGEEVFMRKLAEYNDLTLPAIRELRARKGRIIELDRNDPLSARHDQLLQYVLSCPDTSPVSKGCGQRAQRRLKRRDHKVHGLFDQIINPVFVPSA